MRLTPDQLTAHLQRSLLPIYMIVGDIPLLTQEASERIKNAARMAGYDIQSALSPQNNLDWEQFHINSHSLSLLSPKTFIQLNLGHLKPKKEIINNYLLPYINATPKDKIALITFNKLDATLQNSDWVRAIDKKGALIQVWPITTEQLPQWLNQRMRIRGLSAHTTDIQCIADCVDGNLLAAAQCIEKLYLLYGSRHLNHDEIIESLSDNTKFDSFQWINDILEGNGKKIIHTLDRLHADNTEPVLIVWTITRELRRLIAILAGLESGQLLEPILTQQKVWKKHFSLYKRCIQRMKKIQLEKLLADIHRLELIIKGAAVGNIWDELLMIGLRLAGKT